MISKLMRDHNFFVYPGIELYADFSPNLRVLEIGFGPGVGIKYYLNKYDILIDGVDFSKLMYREAARRNKEYLQSKRLTLHYEDFQFIDLPMNAYDRIIFANVLYFWDDLHSVFRKIMNLLKENGKLTFYMSDKRALDKNKVADNPLFIKYTWEYVQEVLQSCSFQSICINSIGNSSKEYLVISANKNTLSK